MAQIVIVGGIALVSYLTGHYFGSSSTVDPKKEDQTKISINSGEAITNSEKKQTSVCYTSSCVQGKLKKIGTKIGKTISTKECSAFDKELREKLSKRRELLQGN